MICFAEAIEDHSADPTSTVDGNDSTFNTNRYNCKLSLGGGHPHRAPRRQDRIKAIALFEDKESFVTMFTWYREAFGSFSNVSISDGCFSTRSAIIEVMGQEYADGKHLLCVWHESSSSSSTSSSTSSGRRSRANAARGNAAKFNVWFRTCGVRTAIGCTHRAPH